MKSIKIDVSDIANRSIVLNVSAPSEGEYQGHKYSNVYIGILNVSDSGALLPSRLKVKSSVLEALPDGLSVGDLVKFYYDRFGNVDEIDILSDNKVGIE